MTSPLESRVLQRPASVLHYRYRATTTGEWIVFLHGAGMDGDMFAQQFPAIPAGTGIVAWDARGHGRSTLEGPFRYRDMLADLEALVELLNAEDLTLVGQSMGGNLVQSYLDAHPAPVSRAVLVDCTANHGPLTSLNRLSLASIPWVLGCYPWSLAVRQSARACGLAPATAAYAEDRLRRMGKRRFIEVMGFWKEALIPDETYLFPVATLAIVGDRDRSGNIIRATELLATRDPSVTLNVLHEAAHNSNMDQPEHFNEALTHFLHKV